MLHPCSDFAQIMVPHPAGGPEIILVKHGGTVHAYRNICPHIGVGLDYGDGKCLADADTLICAMHGARFEAATGACFDGPCSGDALTRVPIRIEQGRVELADG